jgi:capsular exopolysaccharide synthesis family protein
MGDYTSELSELLPESTPDASTAGIGINVKRLLKLRGRMMALVFFLIAGTGLAAVWIKIPALYIATADLEFQQKAPSLLGPKRSETQRVYDIYVNSQINHIKSHSSLSLFLNDDEKRNSVPALAAIDGNHYGYVRAGLDAAQVKYTELVQVSFADTDPRSAEMIVDFAISSYVEFMKQQTSESGEEALVALRIEEARLKKLLEDLVAELKETGERYQLQISGRNSATKINQNSATENMFSQVSNEWSTARSSMNSLKGLYEGALNIAAAHKKDASIPIYQDEIETKVNADPTVIALATEFENAKARYKAAEIKYQPGYYVVKQAKADQDTALASMETKRKQVRSTFVAQYVDRLKSELEVAKSVAGDMKAEVDALQAKLEAELEVKLQEGQDGLKIEELNSAIEVARKDKGVIDKGIQSYLVENAGPARMRVMGIANASDSPDQSGRIKYGLLSIIAAFTVALMLGIVREFADQNIRSAQDVSYVTDYPVLAAIPHTSEDRIAKGSNLATVAYDYPNSMTSDQYRQTVARMLHWANSGHNIKTCAITSALPGEGKSTLACNLAIALAQSDRRVLLVDINARNPVIEKNFGMEPDIGITDMLSGDSLVRDPDRETSVPNLFVVGPGLRNADLIERLASKEMTDFIHGAERLFDNVIIDTPATLLASEAKLIAPMVSSVIMTTQAGKASFGQLRRSLRSIEENGGTIMGVVVTAVKHVTGGYLRENMNMYYKHDTVNVKETKGKSKTLSPSRTPVLSSKDRHPDEEL